MIGLRRLIIVISIALTVGVLAAFAVVSQAERDDSFEAIATVALERTVPEESLTAERQALIDRLDPDWLAATIDSSGATEVEFLLPDRRNYVAVVARADGSAPARQAADAVAREIVDQEAEALSLPIEADLESDATSIEELDSERSARQAAVDAAIAREATLTVPLGELLSDEDRSSQEALVAEARAEVASLRDARDEIIDEQTALANDIRRTVRGTAQLQPPWMLAARVVTDNTANVLRSAAVTFALSALAAALCVLVMTSPVRRQDS